MYSLGYVSGGIEELCDSKEQDLSWMWRDHLYEHNLISCFFNINSVYVLQSLNALKLYIIII